MRRWVAEAVMLVNCQSWPESRWAIRTPFEVRGPKVIATWFPVKPNLRPGALGRISSCCSGSEEREGKNDIRPPTDVF